MTSADDGGDLRLVRARHDAVNTLVRYLRAVDDQDLDGVLAELRHAAVRFGGPALRSHDEMSTAYRAAFAGGGRTRHLLHPVEVTWDGTGDRIIGRAAYQRWSLDADPPVLTAIGSYSAVFDGADRRLIELTVTRDWQRT